MRMIARFGVLAWRRSHRRTADRGRLIRSRRLVRRSGGLAPGALATATTLLAATTLIAVAAFLARATLFTAAAIFSAATLLAATVLTTAAFAAGAGLITARA